MQLRRYVVLVVSALLVSSISLFPDFFFRSPPAAVSPATSSPSASPSASPSVADEAGEEGDRGEGEAGGESEVAEMSPSPPAPSALPHSPLLQRRMAPIKDLQGKIHPQDPWNEVVSDFLATNAQPKVKGEAAKNCNKRYKAMVSHCPAWDWLRKYQTPIKENRAAVFVDIGCNKGYSSASFFEQFAPESAFNLKALCKEQKQIGTKKWFGVCRDCYEKRKITKPLTPSIRPRVYCIDANPNIHNRTKFCANELQKNDYLAQGMELFLLGMSNQTGIMSYEHCKNREDCGMCRAGDDRRKMSCDDINVSTYDKFAQDHGIGFADLVKLDTEGEEPMIIQGMHNALSSKSVGFLAFEVHGSGKGWFGKFDMTRIVDLMAAYGYICYMDAAAGGKIQLLTGCSWSARFRNSYTWQDSKVKDTLQIPDWYADGVIPQWGNAICGLESHPEIREILRSMS